MDATLHALGGILLKALPTFLLVVLLHFYLKDVFFKPLEKVLHQRYDATEGARKLADRSLAACRGQDGRIRSRHARRARRKSTRRRSRCTSSCRKAQTPELAAARQRAEAAVAEAKAQLAGDVEAAEAGLARDSERWPTRSRIPSCGGSAA